MLKTAAVVFGAVFIALGVLGFVPVFAPDGMLFGLFHVNAAHNVVHLVSGVAALVAGLASVAAARIYFQIFGVVYALVTVLGLFVVDGYILGFLSNNVHTIWLHFLIAATALYLGFGVRPVAETATP